MYICYWGQERSRTSYIRADFPSFKRSKDMPRNFPNHFPAGSVRNESAEFNNGVEAILHKIQLEMNKSPHPIDQFVSLGRIAKRFLIIEDKNHRVEYLRSEIYEIAYKKAKIITQYMRKLKSMAIVQLPRDETLRKIILNWDGLIHSAEVTGTRGFFDAEILKTFEEMRYKLHEKKSDERSWPLGFFDKDTLFIYSDFTKDEFRAILKSPKGKKQAFAKREGRLGDKNASTAKPTIVELGTTVKISSYKKAPHYIEPEDFIYNDSSKTSKSKKIQLYRVLRFPVSKAINFLNFLAEQEYNNI